MRAMVGGLLIAMSGLACGSPPAAPSAPSATIRVTEAASAPDGSTLKVTAPAPQQPAGGSVTTSLMPNLVVANATFRYLGDVPLVRTLQYRFVVETTSGSAVSDIKIGAGVELTGCRVPVGLLYPETTYRWRARAELGQGVGPWSAYWTFTTPKS